jgi:hypothetical protein
MAGHCLGLNLLDKLGHWGTGDALGLLAQLVSSPELVKSKGSWAQMSMLIQATFVTNNLARI